MIPRKVGEEEEEEEEEEKNAKHENIKNIKNIEKKLAAVVVGATDGIVEHLKRDSDN